MLKHRLQSRLQELEKDAAAGGGGGGSFGVTSRPSEETPAAADPSFTDGVATKDIHIDTLTSLSVRIFLPDTCLHSPESRIHRRVGFSRTASDPNQAILRRNSYGSSNNGVVSGGGIALKRVQTVDNNYRRSSLGSSIDNADLKSDNGVYRGYKPGGKNCRKLPILLQFHGGGFVSGSNDSVSNDFFCRRIARLCDVIVLAVGYRLAPENKYPAAFEDGLKVLQWLSKQANLAECGKSLGSLKGGGADLRRSEGNWHVADAFGASLVEPWLAAHGDPSRCVLLGVSCGGNIANYVARKAVEAGNLLDPVKVVAQVLMYPFFNGSAPTQSEIKLANSYFYDKAMCILVWKLFLSDEFSLDHPAANPLAPSQVGPPLKQMPPTLTVVAEHDWMRDRAIAYSEELRKVNVDAPVLEYKDAVHEFATLDMLLKTPQAQACAEDIAIWVKKYISLRGHGFQVVQVSKFARFASASRSKSPEIPEIVSSIKVKNLNNRSSFRFAMERRNRKIRAKSDDRLSSLPDSMLCHILSFLPTKLSVSTSILARRWRFLWTEVLNLDFDCGEHNEISFADTLNKVMLLRKEWDINSFRLILKDEMFDEAHLHTWIITTIARNVQALDIRLRHQVWLPSCLFTSKTVVDLRLHNCGSIPDSIILPNLKKIHLHCFQYGSHEKLHNLISGCPVLEELNIQTINIIDLKHCIISSPTIRRLTLILDWFHLGEPNDDDESDFEDHFENYKLEINTSALTYLVLRDHIAQRMSIGIFNSLIEADIYLDGEVASDDIYCSSVFELLERVCQVKCLTLRIGYYQFLGSSFAAATPKFVNLTKLELDADWFFLLKSLESADNLQVLVIGEGGDYRKHWMEPQQVPSCLSSHLRQVTIHYFEFTEDEFEMVSYIMRNGKVLNMMDIICEKVKNMRGIDAKYTFLKKKFNAFQRISAFERQTETCKLQFS
ncbi:hypothetical protein BUALT_Bualt16G0004600 [Buddleja alternifolia]|uniref:FBD domain-containing protein n=1 Tax=Buddleja alternifolia TaxID=168488 RepID=A0AAV6WEH4_9LAMI|nr:hypothetical protein BUALT_Bualt16G0004600 [Buddleja alternifolia]